MGEGQDATGHSFRPRVSVKEAAKHLGTTADAIRKPAQRGTIAHDKDADGRVWIVLDTDRTRHVGDQGEAGPRHDSESEVLMSEMRSRIEDLREQLEAERQAHAESRRLLAALEQIPAIEVPQGPVDGTETIEEEPERGHRATCPAGESQEGAQRPWWRRLFGA